MSESPLPADLLAACYQDMRRIAQSLIAREAPERTFQATDLAHEASIRLIRANLAHVNGAPHMLALAARTMRRILIDEARQRMADKRQPLAVMTLWPGDATQTQIDLEALDLALAALAQHAPDHAQIVEMRFMLGLSLGEVAAACGVNERTVTRRWQAARVWLLDYIQRNSLG
jgi:RNA polymerase sigma factor (TIGR02999 family)